MIIKILHDISEDPLPFASWWLMISSFEYSPRFESVWISPWGHEQLCHREGKVMYIETSCTLMRSLSSTAIQRSDIWDKEAGRVFVCVRRLSPKWNFIIGPSHSAPIPTCMCCSVSVSVYFGVIYWGKNSTFLTGKTVHYYLKETWV